MFQGKVRIISNEEVMPSVNLLRLEAPEIASAAAPGQFAMVCCSAGPERLLRRPISFQGIKNNTVSFLFAGVGKGTEWLAARRAGEQIDVLGPLGSGFSSDPSPHRLLLVAGGMGIAPLCYLAEDRLMRGCHVKILAGARTAAMLPPPGLIPPGVELVAATEDGASGYKGMITALIPDHLPWAQRAFICGPLLMYQAIRRDFRDHPPHIPVEVSLEVRMGCGLGFCYACTIPTAHGLKQVCKDGPVFPLDEIIWDELK